MKDPLDNRTALQSRLNEIIEAANATAKLPRKGTSFPDDLAYLADCSEATLDNFILHKMESAAQHASVIKGEQRAMVDDLARVEAMRLIKLLLDDQEMMDKLSRRQG